MVHPVPYDVGMEVGLPCGIVSGCSIMPLVTVDEDLQGCDAPTLVTYLTETLQLFHCGVILDYDNALFERSAATDDGHLSGLLVYPFTVFGLHRPTCLLLNHCGYLIVAFSQRGITQFRCYPCFISRHEVGTDVELFLADIGKVFRRPSVMRSAAADVARLDVY